MTQPASERDWVKQRIAKLLNMTLDNGASENEAMMAADKAAELMAFYDIEASELSVRSARAIKQTVRTRKYGNMIIGAPVARHIAQLCDCMYWGSTEETDKHFSQQGQTSKSRRSGVFFMSPGRAPGSHSTRSCHSVSSLMARARTAIVMSTPRERASFPTICLACSIARFGRQLRLTPRLLGRRTGVYGLMSAPAYEAYGAEAEGRCQPTSRVAARSHAENRIEPAPKCRGRRRPPCRDSDRTSASMIQEGGCTALSLPVFL